MLISLQSISRRPSRLSISERPRERRSLPASPMGPPPIMLRIMFALIDTDSDGTISLQEFQAAHERIFKVVNTDKDGKIDLEEMQAFMHGTK